MKTTCPKCGHEYEIPPTASEIGKKGGSATTDAKRKASADNLARARAEGKGGRPKGSKNKKKEE
jgi:hypothetical protein